MILNTGNIHPYIKCTTINELFFVVSYFIFEAFLMFFDKTLF
jgi:hypothetical protein